MLEKYLNNRLYTLYFIPFLLGLLSVFSFQPFNLSIINFFSLPLFFFIIIFIKKKSKSTYRKKPYKKNLFIFGTLFGFGFYLGGIHWITNSLTFDENFKILIPFSLFLIPIFLSLFFSLTVLVVGPFLSFNLSSILILSGGLALSDYLRAKILTGFPWNLWAYSFSWSEEIIQILNISGLFAFNLITITIFMLPAIFFFKITLAKKLFCISIVPITLFAFYIYGNYSINQNQKKLNKIEKKYNIKVVSPNFQLEYGLNLDDIKSRAEKLIRYSDPDKNLKTLFIWPEGVFSGYDFFEIQHLKKIFSKNFSSNHFILFGVNRFDEKVNGTYNSLVVVNNRFEILQEYKKQKLVPFGEFLPFEKLLNKFGFKKITEGHGSFLKGNNFDLLKVGELKITPLICYEIIFTELLQQNDKNSNLIINISEDGWFGNSIGPYQHFAKSIYRAIENNSFLVRSANKGITAIINNKGQILRKLNPKETGNIELELPLLKSNNKNKNDLIFFVLLITYILTFYLNRKRNDKK